MAANAAHYDPLASQMDPSTLSDFLQAPLTGGIQEVPGVGPANADILASGDRGGSVTNTYQLIGTFLTLRPDEDDPAEHCERFYLWLQTKGVNAQRNTIVQAIAEKTNLAYPGIYDATLYA